MDTTTSISNKNAIDLLKGISLSNNLQKSRDSILLAEDQYPENLDPIFSKSDQSTDLTRIIDLLRWNRQTDKALLDSSVYDRMAAAQEKIRKTLQLTPTTDNPWERHVFKDWRHRVTNICLQAVQRALEGSERNNANLLFTPQDATAASGVHSIVASRKSHSKSNIEGLLLYHPLIVQHPWEPPKDLDRLIDDLIAERKTYIVQRAYNPWDQNDANKARSQIEELKNSLKPLLTRIYSYTSNAFHVLLKYLIPRAEKNYMFTRIKGARMEHILRRREWEEGRRSSSLPALTDEEKLPHSAAHTLAFILKQYVDADDDAPHTTWDRILKATREPRTSLYSWADSFTVHMLRHSESTAKKIGRKKRIKINKIISKQITEDEKLIITTLDQKYTSAYINAGDYILGDLINMLAQHTSNFAGKRYVPSDHPRIIAYLKIRARNSGIPLPGFLTQSSKIAQSPPSAKRRRILPTQRAWTYLMNDSSSSSPTTFDKGKSKGKGKGKSKSKSTKGKLHTFGKSGLKGKGKPISWSKGKGKPKGLSKGSRSYPTMRPHPVMHGTTNNTSSSSTSDNSSGKGISSSNATAGPTVRCHFCNKPGHYKSNCRQYQALRNSSAYQSRLTHPARTQLIYDHLEDSVYAPRSCPTSSCTNTSCDGHNCFTSFPQDEFQSAEAYFNDNLLHAVENAKLDRPIDSTPPLAHNTYVAQEVDWGDPWGDYQAYQSDEWDEPWYEEDDTQEYAMEHEEEQDDDHEEEVFTTHDDAITLEDMMEEGNASGEEDGDFYE